MMKQISTKYKALSRVFLQIILMIMLISCDDMLDQTAGNNDLPGSTDTRSVYILSEGLFNMNNSSLALYNLQSGKLEKDIFLAKNKRGLGDTANDMAVYGSKLYVVVNVSSQIEVIDAATGMSVKRIPLFDDKQTARQPRYITFYENKAYVSCFDGTVVRIDTASLQIDAVVRAGRNPDGIAIAQNKIYVSNSGGLSFPNYDNTVSVIDITTFTEIKKIPVAVNPSVIHADSRGDVYVVSRGDYGSDSYLFQRINTLTDKLEETFEGLKVLNFTIHRDTAYLYHHNFDGGEPTLKLFDCNTEKIVEEQFISDGTKLQTPYGISVNPYNGDVYLTDARSYVMWGHVLCFDKQGKLKFRINEIGLNPNKMVFY
jgi:YVTN family beta-propeller protein